MHFRVVATSLLFVLVSAGTGGCGSDGDVAPKRWAQSVCTTLTPWRAEIADLTTKAQQQLQAAKTASQTKSNIVDLLRGAESASEKARLGVVAAGVPDVSGGTGVSQQFIASLSKARDAYGNAKRSVEALQPADAKAFYTAVGSTFAVLKEEYEQSAIDPKHVGPKELQKAFNEVPECR
jgi:hypothetical protein